MNNQSLTIYTSAFVDEIARIGIKNCVISPGSRSTPLALLLAEHKELNTYMNIDERSAGFFAMGIAKESMKPVVLACTSGTAAANYYPAVVEASYSKVPLIVITADRPPELREVGAPQAIQQLDLYGRFVKSSYEAALPESSEEMTIYARTLIRRAIAAATKSPCGPIHINIPFREPLIPNLTDPHLFSYGRSIKPFQLELGKRALSDSAYTRIADELKNIEKGIIVCGPQADAELPQAVITLAKVLGFPIFADPLSNLRQSGMNSSFVLEGYDAFLKNEKLLSNLKPELILRFGAMPVSKPYLLAVKNKWRDIRHIIVDGGGEWLDPAGVSTDMYYCDETIFCNELMKRFGASTSDKSLVKQKWIKQWYKINDMATSILSSVQLKEQPSEGRAIYELNDLLPEDSNLFVANSMPIRDVDTFLHVRDKRIRVFCNRGANGIDGNTSTALGVAVSGKPTLFVTGDLTFFHDLNGLAASILNEIDLTIVLINNNGGGIFSFLPQAQSIATKQHFERLFLTSLHLDFKHAAELYNAKYTKIETWGEYRQAVKNGLSSKGIQIIEVPTNREENVIEHRELWQAVVSKIDEILMETNE